MPKHATKVKTERNPASLQKALKIQKLAVNN
jgi:hypothetical protein